MLKASILIGSGTAALVAGGAFLQSDQLACEAAQQRQNDMMQKARTNAEQMIEQTLPNARSDWRNTMPMVKASVGGQARTDLSRQEIRTSERSIAKNEASLQRIAARREAKLNRKRRRAGTI